MKQIDYREYIEKTKRYYDIKFGEAAGISLNEEEKNRWNIIQNILKSYQSTWKKKKTSILDFGCGDGRFTKLLGQYGNVSGVDISEKAIKKAKKNVPEGKFFVADLSSKEILRQLNSQFDIIISTEVIEHIFDQQLFLENIQHLLSKDGVFILTTPNGKCYRHYFGKGSRTFGQAYEWWLYPETLEQMMSEVKLKTQLRFSFNHEWIFKRRPRSWLRLIGNRYFYVVLKVMKLIKPFKYIMQEFDMGLYLVFVAKLDQHGA